MDGDLAPHELSIDGFHSTLRNGELTAVELVDWYLDRIESNNTSGAQIQAVVTTNPRAREDAAAQDEFLAANGRLSGPLHGVPVLVKDQVETAGIRTTFGSILFEHYVPQRDATVVTKLRKAGAVILAKTSLCDFAAGWFSSSSMTDHTKNPYCLTREAGGSSAGTAAGIAANFGLTGIGEDTGGSIRIPASFNNLFGLRVTTGLISRTGLSPLVHFQDTPGPIARTASDMARTLDSIVGYDPEDPLTVRAGDMSADGGYAKSLDKDVPLTRWRIGVLESGFGSDGNPDVEPVNGQVRAAIRCLDELGVPITPGLQIPELSSWITDTAGYVQQSKSDITAFLAARPTAPVSSFMDVYDSRRFHPLNDLFHGIAGGPEKVDEGGVPPNPEWPGGLSTAHCGDPGRSCSRLPRLSDGAGRSADADRTCRCEVRVPDISNQHGHRIPSRIARTDDSSRVHRRRSPSGNGTARLTILRGQHAAVRTRMGEVHVVPHGSRSLTHQCESAEPHADGPNVMRRCSDEGTTDRRSGPHRYGSSRQ